LYCWDIDEYSDFYWKEKLEENEVGQINREAINKCISTGKQWQMANKACIFTTLFP